MACLAIGGCDKNMPGAMIAIARLNIPAIFVYGGTIKPGHYEGRDLTIVSAFEAVGQYSAKRIDAAELLQVERLACPGAGSCGGMFTANTMSAAIEAMGLSLPFSSTMAAEDQEKADSAAKSGQVLARAITKGILPRDILTRKAFENAINVVMAVGGSTNAVLHLLAIAHAAGVTLTLDDFEELREQVPVFCDLKPSGRYVATDLHRAGGIPQVMKMLLVHGRLHGDALTITGADARGGAPRCARRTARRSRRDPSLVQTALRTGASGNPEREPGDGRRGGEDHRREGFAVHRPRARVRFGRGLFAVDLVGRYQARRRSCDSLRRAAGRSGNARNAGAHLCNYRRGIG